MLALKRKSGQNVVDLDYDTIDRIRVRMFLSNDSMLIENRKYIIKEMEEQAKDGTFFKEGVL